MTEQILTTTERLERLDLDGLKAGDTVKITIRKEDEDTRFKFVVEEPKTEPIGQFTEIQPDGFELGPFRLRLVGTGRWNTLDQNPNQGNDLPVHKYLPIVMMTIASGSLYEGDYLIMQEPDFTGKEREDLYVFGLPGWEITEITVDRA